MFSRIQGHGLPRQWLAQAVRSGRTAGAYLFMGPEGIGKHGLALEFAAALRCLKPRDGWACGECNECVRVAKGVHPSVLSFAKPADKSAFPVELVREIVEQAGMKRLEPGRRVFIIDDADRFNESSANAFLKTLEEPPPEFAFVLLAGNAAQMLPTIVSRCQSVRFSPLDEEAMAEITRGWEGLPVNPDSRAVLLRVAQGSPGRLRRLVESKALDVVREFLKAVRGDPFTAAETLAAALTGDDNEQKRERLRDVLALLSAVLRDRLTASLGCEDVKPLTKAVGNEHAYPDGLVTTLERLEDLRERVDGNANLKLACDALALVWPE